MHLRQRARRNRHGTRLLVQLLLAIGLAPDVDMQRLDVVGPVAAGDLGVRANGALLVLGLGVGVVAQDAYFIVAGAAEVGDDQVDQVVVVVTVLAGVVVLGRRVLVIIAGGRFGGFGFDGTIDLVNLSTSV